MRQIRQDIFLEQQQKLYMTTELRQAISVLQMSALELNDYIEKKMEENPFLDEDNPPNNSNEEDPVKYPDKINVDDIIEQLQDSSPYYNSAEQVENNPYEKYLSDKPSLYEHLECQLYLELENPTDILIGKYLIGNIDRNGYLCIELTEVEKRLNISLDRVKKVLHVIQTFNPAGIGARNLQECLLLQLKSRGQGNILAQRIIEKHLKELAERKLNKIAGELSVPVRKVQEVHDFILSLDPKPGLQFGSDNNPIIWPDVSVVKDQGTYTILVNDLDFSFLRINNSYANLFRQAALSEDVRKYLEEKFELALGLIRGIEQRRLNIYKVVKCIVDIQSDFFDKGIEYLKPLTMSQVAEMVNIHESTVSRVACNKYIQTPRGLFALKYFFNSGLDSAASDKVCSKSIKYLIREIIRTEDAESPLSDQEIMEILIDKGIKISRRTVNKYRQSMGIASNTLRKRF
jgi:RNA polymerase sigma-54 factor